MSAGLHGTPARVVARGWGWRHAGRRAHAVRGLDLVIEPGERVLLLGPSGAGKSTLLAALAGVLGGADEGDEEGGLVVDGTHPAATRGRAGLVQQDPDAGAVLARVGDDVAFGCENLAVPPVEIWGRVAEALDAVGLAVPLDASTSQLSGGQKQRLALAGILAMRPGLVLLDEPTANLDPTGVGEVRAAVARMLERTGATLVVVEHRTAVWADLVSRVVVLAPGGGVSADGTPDAVFAERGAELAAQGVWVPGRPLEVGESGAGDVLPPAVPLLRSERLVVGRGGRRPEPIARVADLSVAAGEALAVLGPNGAGKTTLGLTLGGLLRPAAGRVVAEPLLAGGAGEAPGEWRSRELLSRIGSVFQNPEHQFVTGSVAEELALGPRLTGASEDDIAARVDELLERLRLTALAAANPFTLSGGEKRRLSVATTLATRPRIVVLDEPTFGQDARTWVELVRLLQALRGEGVALVAVTHDADFVDAIGARRMVLAARSGGDRAA